MRKRRIILVLLILAVAGVVGFIVAGAFREREPEYGGKRLSEWVLLCAEPGPHSPTYEECVVAVRECKTNALPYLVKWMRYKRPRWKETLYGACNPVLRALNPQWELTDQTEQQRENGAWIAFSSFYTNAKPAMQYLRGLLNDSSPVVSTAASNLVLKIDSEATP